MAKGGYMARKTDNFQIVLIGAGLGLFLLFHTVWSILFEDWVKHQLEKIIGQTVAEMIEKFGALGFPLLGAIAIVWFLWTYLKRRYEARSDRGLYVECTSVLPNRTVPAHGRTFWLDLTHRDIEDICFGLHTQTFSQTGVLGVESGDTIGQCRVTNYDLEPMLNITLSLEIISHDAISEPNGSYRGDGPAILRTRSINIEKIDPGADNSFVFYVKNLSPDFFQIAFHPEAAVERLGKEKIETVPVASNLSHPMIFRPHTTA
jgi:hypothetical protein